MSKAKAPKRYIDPEVLEGVRGRLGLNTDDDSQDKKIMAMSAHKIARLWTGWMIGDESWADRILKIFADAGGVIVDGAIEDEADEAV